MKPTRSLLSFLFGSVFLTAQMAQAVNYYWDGTSTTVNGLSSSTTATTWSTSAGNWDNGSAEVLWTTANSAVFGGTASTVTIGTGGVSIGGGSQFMRFDVTGYILDAGANGFNFGTSATDNITLFANHTGAAATTTFTNTVGGSGNVILSAQNGGVANANTFLFNGTSAGGWSGTTTVNAGVTLSVAASSQALLNTTGGITLNGGNILLTNTATGSENTIDRINDTAAISSYGSGSILIANTATASRVYSESIGSITHNNGQLNLGFTTVQNQTANTQTLFLDGLTNSGTTSTIAISSGGSGAGSIHGNSNIRVNGVTTSTAAGQIIGPWMTAGTAANAQSDWAVYNSDGVSGRVQSAGISASAQTTWTSTTGNYTAANANPLTSTVNNRLTADRYVNTLRATFAESAAATHTIDIATDTIAFAGHALTDGDVVTFRSAGGLTDTRPYYVISSVAGTSFQLSLTPGGSVFDLTSATEGFIATGINLDGNTLGMNGYITGTTGSAAIGGGSASTITLATATTGNLYLHGANNIWIDPSIKDNGAGVLTLVKSGTNTVTLSGANTYTGGTVINAGTLAFNTTAAAQSGSSRNITFGGSGTLTTPDTSSFGTLTVDQGAVATLSGNNITFATTTGSGTVTTGSAQSKTLNLGDASTFTGNIALGYAFNNLSNGTASIQFTKLNDAAGSSIQIFRNGGGTDSGQVGQIALTGDVAPLTFNNRQIQLLPRTTSNSSLSDHVLYNNNATAANKWVINTSLLNLNDRNLTSFTLAGSNAGDNAFNGTIGDSTVAAGLSLVVQKTGTGKWILGGANTFTGGLVINQGTLSVATLNEANTAGALGMNTTLQLGGSALRQKGSAQGSIGAANNNSGTLEYTGGAVTSTRSFYIGDSAAGSTGGGTIANNGTGAITFSAAAFNPTQTGITGTRTLTLSGINTDNNEVQGIIRDNVASTGKVNIAKTGIGTWILSGSNAMTGTSNISGGGTLILNHTTNDNAKLASGVLTLDGGNIIFRGGSANETVASTTVAANNTGTFFTRETGSAFAINLGAITRATSRSVISFTHENMAITTADNNATGVLGSYATVGSHWAVKNAGAGLSGNIIAYAGYTTFNTATTDSTAGNELINFKLDGIGTGTLSNNARVSTLRIENTANDQVLNLGSNSITFNTLTGGASSPHLGGLLYTGGAFSNYTINGSGTLASVHGNGQALLINTYDGTLNINAKVVSGGSSDLVKTGAGTLVLGADNAYTGGTRVYQGVLRLAHNNGAGATGAITVQNGAAVELMNGINVPAKTLTITGTGVSNGGALRSVASATSSYAGAITLGTGGARINSDSSGALTLSGGVITSANNNVTFGGAGNTTVSTVAISGAGGVTKDGAGITTLSATNTYTGATTVSDGTLLVNGSTVAASTVSVSAAGTLGGTGMIAGAVNVTGQLSPGASIETLGTGALALLNGSTLVHELDSSVATSAGSDLLKVAGNLDLVGTVGLTLDDLAVSDVAFADNDVYSLINYTGTWNNGMFTFSGNELSDEEVFAFGLNTWKISYDDVAGGLNYSGEFAGGADSFVNLTVVSTIPEPGAVFLGSMGLLLILRRRR